MFLTRSLHDFCSPYITPLDPQGGFSLIQAMQVRAAPTGRVFGPFWSENEYKFCPFWFGIGYGFLPIPNEQERKRNMRIRDGFAFFLF